MIIDFMKKFKLHLVFSVIIAVLISVLILFFINKEKSPYLELKYAEPESGLHDTPFTTYAINFHFNESLDADTISISIRPETDITYNLGNNGDVLIVRPKGFWKSGIDYKIIIDDRLESASGNKLKGSIVYKFRLIEPKYIIAPD